MNAIWVIAVVVLSKDNQGNAGLRRCWWYACRVENIDPRQPSRRPLLFALDAKLGIADGFRYVPDCQSVRRHGDDSQSGTVYCGGDFGSSSFDGSTEGFGDAGGDASGGGCGGGD